MVNTGTSTEYHGTCPTGLLHISRGVGRLSNALPTISSLGRVSFCIEVFILLPSHSGRGQVEQETLRNL